MGKKELFRNLLAKAVKALVVLFTLFAMGWFVDQLPFAWALPFFTQKLPVSVLLNAVVSLLAAVALVKIGREAAPEIDGLLDFMPRAGELFCDIIKILALLFSYYAFQPAILPFVGDFNWVYQSVFLGFTLFFLARTGLQVYGCSGEISRFLLGMLSPYKASPPAQK